MHIELLEARIAPATLVNPTTVIFQDIDGDTAILKLSKPLLDKASINDVLKFSTGSVDGNNSNPQQLELIDLTEIPKPSAVEGLHLTLSIKRRSQHGGDGLVNLGSLDALGLDLGKVTIGGDLGDIEAGNTNVSTPSLKTLTVESIGALGGSTQAPGSDLHSHLKGFVPRITVKGDIVGATLEVFGESGGGKIDGGGIGKLRIGGWVRSDGAQATAGVLASGSIGAVSIGGSDHDGARLANGHIASLSSMRSITMAGAAMGGAGTGSGAVISFVSVGPLAAADALQGDRP